MPIEIQKLPLSIDKLPSVNGVGLNCAYNSYNSLYLDRAEIPQGLQFDKFIRLRLNLVSEVRLE